LRQTSPETLALMIDSELKSPGRRPSLEENIAAAEIELTTDELREIERATANIDVQGARYPEHIEQMSYR
jgi:hypothetical protein